MREIVECVPNFSEGRRRDVVDAIVAAIGSVSGVRVLDREMDADHNRCVITFVGDRQGVAAAAFLGARVAVDRIDMNVHRGEHPRVGALDVLPFVPIAGVTMDDCVALARAFRYTGTPRPARTGRRSQTCVEGSTKASRRRSGRTRTGHPTSDPGGSTRPRAP